MIIIIIKNRNSLELSVLFVPNLGHVTHIALHMMDWPLYLFEFVSHYVVVVCWE